MNIRLVLMLSLLGVVFGLLTVMGVIREGWGFPVQLVLALFCAATLANRAPGRFFLHGFLTGLIFTALATLIQAALLEQYLANNPKAADSFSRLPGNLSPVILLVLMTPIIAAISGVFFGFLTWLWARVARPKPATA